MRTISGTFLNYLFSRYIPFGLLFPTGMLVNAYLTKPELLTVQDLAKNMEMFAWIFLAFTFFIFFSQPVFISNRPRRLRIDGKANLFIEGIQVQPDWIYIGQASVLLGVNKYEGYIPYSYYYIRFKSTLPDDIKAKLKPYFQKDNEQINFVNRARLVEFLPLFWIQRKWKKFTIRKLKEAGVETFV